MLFSIFLACKLTLVSSCHVNKKGKNNNNNKSDEKAAPCNETLDLTCFQQKRSKTQAEFKKEKKKEICVSTSRIVKRKTVCYDLHDEIWRWCIAQKQPTWQRGAPEHFLNQSNNTEGIKRIRCYHGFFQVHVQDLKKNITSKNTEAAFRPEHPYFVSVLRPHIQARAQSNARTTSDPKPTHVQRDVM